MQREQTAADSIGFPAGSAVALLARLPEFLSSAALPQSFRRSAFAPKPQHKTNRRAPGAPVCFCPAHFLDLSPNDVPNSTFIFCALTHDRNWSTRTS